AGAATSDTVNAEITSKSSGALKRMFAPGARCLKCHESSGMNQGVPKEIVPTQVPAVWFKHARFNHTAHRAVDCNECHSAAQGSKTRDDMMIPKIDNCRKCHAPLSNGNSVRYDCAECHTYHNGDNDEVTKGTRGISKTRTIDDFLKGLGAKPAAKE